MTNYEINLNNLRSTLLQMGLSNINADVICESLDEQNRINRTCANVYTYPPSFVNQALCWGECKEGALYWVDVYDELASFIRHAPSKGYVLGDYTKSIKSREPLFVMKTLHNFNILD